MIKLLIALLAMILSTSLAAEVNLFAEHQSMHLTSPAFYSDSLYIDRYEPQRNEFGIEYRPNKLSYRISFIDATSGDNGFNEYNHQGVTLGIKYCLVYCK